MAVIPNPEALRARLGAPHPATEKKILNRLDEQAVAFIRDSPFLLMATADAEGMPDVSPKGDEPGFVRVENDRTLLFPEREGNNLAFGLRNLLVNPHLSLIFMIPGTGETLRVSGRATLLDDPDLLQLLEARGKPARLALRVDVTRVLFHCARSTLRVGRWKPDDWPARRKVSFGKIIAPRLGQGDAVAKQIDEFVEAGYRTGL